MRGQVKTTGRGDFENVRVARDAILQEFPAEPPGAADLQPRMVTDDEICEVIRAACESNGGFIAQNLGAELVQKRFPEVSRDRAIGSRTSLTQCGTSRCSTRSALSPTQRRSNRFSRFCRRGRRESRRPSPTKKPEVGTFLVSV
jgi:hypothetical protein